MGLNLAALHDCYDNTPIGFTVIELVLDEAGQPIDWIFRYLNDELARIEKVPKEQLLDHYFYRDVFPQVNAKKWLDFYYRSAFLGETIELHDYSPEISKYLKIKSFPWKKRGFCACVLFEETRERQLQYRLDHLVHMAHYDSATDVQNRNSYESFCAHFAERNGGATVHLMPDADHCELWNLSALIGPIKDAADELPCVAGTTVGVFFVDVNELKRVNDTFGHESGTFMLRFVSDAIKEVLSGYNFQLFRVGGDEFVVVMPSIAKEHHARLEQEIKDALVNREIQHWPRVLAAVGSAWESCASSIEALVARADQRMYEHKRTLKLARA